MQYANVGQVNLSASKPDQHKVAVGGVSRSNVVTHALNGQIRRWASLCECQLGKKLRGEMAWHDVLWKAQRDLVIIGVARCRAASLVVGGTSRAGLRRGSGEAAIS